MSEYPTLTRAPITEALIDLQVALPPDVGLAGTELFGAAVADAYPNRTPRSSFSVQVNLRPDGADSAADAHQVGFLFTSADGRQIAQARTDGFTLSRLQPYRTWDSLRSEARRLWAIYVEACRPVHVRRVAVRYINKIPLAGPSGDIQDYVRTYPELADGVPNAVSEFFMRVGTPVPDTDAMAILTEALVHSPDGGEQFGLILDIDVFETGEWSTAGEDIWNLLERLRGHKNDIFFKTLTPQALEQFL